MFTVLVRHRPDTTPESFDLPKHARKFGSQPSWAGQEWMVDYSRLEDAQMLMVRLNVNPGVKAELWSGYEGPQISK